MTSFFLPVFFIAFIALMVFIVGKQIYDKYGGNPISARLQRDKLGKEKYNELKNNFDARRIMGELNYLIDEINEYWEQNQYFEVKPAESIGGKIMQNWRYDGGRSLEDRKLYHITKKTLDDCIKKEWNPRIKILRENSTSYYSDKELRDAFTQFSIKDREVQKLTIEGKATQEFNKTLKVAGIGLVVVTGLAIGAVGAANRFGDRQSFRDNFGA
jgi:hypothetical protein